MSVVVFQVVLPVIFVTLAMFIGVIGGPTVREETALELSTALYFNETKSIGDHYVPYSDHRSYDWSYDAPPADIIQTFLVHSLLHTLFICLVSLQMAVYMFLTGAKWYRGNVCTRFTRVE